MDPSRNLSVEVMFKNQGWPVVEPPIVVRVAMHYSRYGAEDWAVYWAEDIHT